jgi:hypothetical protein
MSSEVKLVKTGAPLDLQRHRVAKKIVHEQYDPATQTNSIALIKLHVTNFYI